MNRRASSSFRYSHPRLFSKQPTHAAVATLTRAREEGRVGEREGERERERMRRRESACISQARDYKAAKDGRGGKGCICPARGCCLSPVVILQSAVSTHPDSAPRTRACSNLSVEARCFVTFHCCSILLQNQNC